MDASVARSAGWETAPDPNSRICREVLESMLSICHKVVLSEECLAEWRKHQSGFARRWLVRMFSRRKAILAGDIRNDGLREKLRQAAARDFDWRAIEKDAHLVEAALAHDGIVLSRDERMRGLLKQAASEVRELTAILWGNPVIEEERIIAWLEGGAKLEQPRKLGYR